MILFNLNIKHIRSKISSASYIIAKVRHYLNKNTLKLIYNSLVKPHLNYCITAWGGANTTSLQPIVRLQKKIIRMITKNSFNSHTKPLFIKYNILPLNLLYKFNTTILLHKIHNKSFIGSYNLTNLNKIHNHNTRLSKQSNFYQNFTRTKTAQSTFSAQGTKFWKTVPSNYKILPLHLFKKKMKQYLINSLNEKIT